MLITHLDTNKILTYLFPNSVTRFGEISTFGNHVQKSLAIFQRNCLVFGNILNLLKQTIRIEQSFIVVNIQILKNSLPIWSHWFQTNCKLSIEK